MKPLSPIFSRLLAVAILAAVLWVGVFAVARPLLDAYGAAIDSAAQMRAAILRAGPISRDNAALQAELSRLKERKVLAIGLLQSPNESLAAVALQDRIKSAVGVVRGDLRSTQILSARDEGKFRRIGIRGQIAVDIAGLQRVFYDLETGSPLLFLDNVEIRVPERPRGGGPPSSSLDVRFDLYGYVAKPT